MASFLFVLTLIEFEGQLSHKLTEQYTLKRADKSQVAQIQQQLDAIAGFLWHRDFRGYRYAKNALSGNPLQLPLPTSREWPIILN